MAAPHSIDPAQLLEQHLQGASPDLLRQMIASLANAMMSAQADQVCGAAYGERSDERTNQRNGYRAREWDTRAGTVELAVPKLREGAFFPDWLLTHRRRAEQALVTVVATAYLLGVSTRRVERLAEQLGVKSLSRSQVSEMATHLDAQVSAFRQRPLDQGPYTFVWVDALTVKVREDGRVVNVHALVATGVTSCWTTRPRRPRHGSRPPAWPDSWTATTTPAGSPRRCSPSGCAPTCCPPRRAPWPASAELRPAAAAAQRPARRLRRRDRRRPRRAPRHADLRQLPGVGPTLTGVLLAEIGEDRTRFPTPAVLLAEAGLAPVTRASGRSHNVRFRYAANTRLREAAMWWAYNSGRGTGHRVE